jgi:DNA-binding response OmpR family regulator
MRILVIEDDPALSSILVRILKEESYAVDLAMDGLEGEWMAFETSYDLIVLDLMLPTKDGITVLQDLRAQGVHTPVMILTARDTKDELIKGLDIGADDYVTKPFDLNEFVARARALIRRRLTTTSTTLEAGSISLNPATKEVFCSGQKVNLTTKEYGLLEYFARNQNHVLSRTQLSEHVWDQNFEPTSNVVDVYVGYLRNKIDKNLGTNFIRTVRGHGYMLDTRATTSTDLDKGLPEPHAY